MELHAKKLKEIQERDAAKIKKSLQTDISKTLKEHKTKNQGFLKNEKNAEINRENQILLNKLVEISNGKWSTVSQPKKKVKKIK